MWKAPGKKLENALTWGFSGALGEIRTSFPVPAAQYHVMPEYAFDRPKDGSKLLRRASRFRRILGRRDHVRDHGRDLENDPV